jgi:hypothetical protein
MMQLPEKLADVNTIMNKLVFSDEATFRLSERVNRHNLRMWDSKNPHESFERDRDSSKFNVFEETSREKP